MDGGNGRDVIIGGTGADELAALNADDIVDEVGGRFTEFFPNVENIQDIVEKHLVRVGHYEIAKAGLEEGSELIGGSAIIAPTGEIVAAARDRSAADSPAARPATVLVVEDDPAVRRLAVSILEREVELAMEGNNNGQKVVMRRDFGN